MPTEMLHRPRLHRGYHVADGAEPGTRYVFSDARTFLLESDALLDQLLPLLDGSHRLDDLALLLPDIEPDSLMQAIASLHQAGLLEDADTGGDLLTPEQKLKHAAQIALLSHFSPHPEQLMSQLLQSHVSILGSGTTGRALAQSLAASGIGTITTAALPDQQTTASNGHRPTGDTVSVTKLDRDGMRAVLHDTRLLIVALDAPDSAVLATVNEVCVATGTEWLPIVIRGWEGTIGPAVIPGETPCYTCYDLRMKSHLTHFEEHLLIEGYRQAGLTGDFGTLPQFSTILANLAALEIIKMLTHFVAPTTYGRLLTIDFRTLSTEKHDIIRVPRCPVCGEPARQRPMMKPWTIQP